MVRLLPRRFALLVLPLLATGCTAIVSTQSFHPRLVQGPPDATLARAAAGAWDVGARFVLSGEGPVLRIERAESELRISTEVVGGRTWSIGPILPVLPILVPHEGDATEGLAVNVAVERAGRPVRLVLQDLVLRPLGSNAALRPRRYTRTRWQDNETRPVPAGERTEILLGEREMVWLLYDVPTAELDRFDLRLPYEETPGEVLQCELDFRRARTTFFVFVP